MYGAAIGDYLEDDLIESHRTWLGDKAPYPGTGDDQALLP
jgi:hypothetical protein